MEQKALIELFNDFIGLPNLHTNCHLLRHARTFGTLMNTEVRMKEMVHRIFKNMVPRTNRKNIKFDLLKHYTILQPIQHLADSRIDPQNLQSSIEIMNISQDFNHLFKDWFIMESSEMDDKELLEGTRPDLDKTLQLELDYINRREYYFIFSIKNI
ncbi:hypothetical protein C1646_671685 [Rhizophagus diaphanus]|nr:hypothetical protein C1646_671685 [Rhizophagus diaphanus] [Rhizophagus sp. MUCL 43196]